MHKHNAGAVTDLACHSTPALARALSLVILQFKISKIKYGFANYGLITVPQAHGRRVCSLTGSACGRLGWGNDDDQGNGSIVIYTEHSAYLIQPALAVSRFLSYPFTHPGQPCYYFLQSHMIYLTHMSNDFGGEGGCRDTHDARRLYGHMYVLFVAHT